MRTSLDMARYVHEIMNPELFFLRPSDTVGSALLGILSLGVTAAPVVDGEHRPVGVVSLRDLISETGGVTVGDRMNSPVATVSGDAEIPDGARQLAERGVHHLVTVDDEGRALGVVSSLDFLRALLDLPERHPAAFPHQDATGVSWSDPFELVKDRADLAPDGPGLLVLMHDEPGRATVPVWAESTPDLRRRLHELISAPSDADPWLKRILDKGALHLQFRVAAVSDAGKRSEALAHARRMVASAAGLPVPS